MDEGHTRDDEGRSTRGHIIIIDADPYSTELLEGALETKGYCVQSVTTAAEARAVVPQEPPDLILMDLHLPDSDGLSLMKELKEDERASEVPVILMSSRDDVDAKVKASSTGASTTSPSPSRRAKCWPAWNGRSRFPAYAPRSGNRKPSFAR
jgi:PleD family two-component response regulator